MRGPCPLLGHPVGREWEETVRMAGGLSCLQFSHLRRDLLFSFHISRTFPRRAGSQVCKLGAGFHLKIRGSIGLRTGRRINQSQPSCPFHCFPWLSQVGLHFLVKKDIFCLSYVVSFFYLDHRESNKCVLGLTAGKRQSQDIKCEPSKSVNSSHLRDPLSPESHGD